MSYLQSFHHGDPCSILGYCNSFLSE